MAIELLIDELEFETVEEMQTVKEVRELAMIETGRIIRGTVKEFSVVESVGNVVLVKFEPEHYPDPVVPIVLNQTNAMRKAARAFVHLMYLPLRGAFYLEATQAAARYLQCATGLETGEYAYLKRQLQLCCVDPQRKAMKDGER